MSLLFYGVASIRTGSPSRTVGLLLLVPVVAFLGQAVLLLTKILADSVLAGAQLILAGIMAVALLAVGYLLRSEGVPTDRAESVPTEVHHD